MLGTIGSHWTSSSSKSIKRRCRMSDDTKPFYASDQRPPQHQPKPGETLCEFVVGHTRWLVELRHHGKHGVEAQFFRTKSLYGRCASRPESRRSTGPRPNVE